MTDFSVNLDPALLGTASYGDLLMLNGDLVLTQDADTRGTNPVKQQILANLKTFQGEFFLDNTLGVPWYQSILGSGHDLSGVDSLLKSVILSTPGVQQLTAWAITFDRPRRILAVNFTVTSVAGVISYSGTVSPQTSDNNL